MRIKLQQYEGKPAIALFVDDKTTKIQSKLLKMKRQEEHMKTRQSESYTSTLSHEMRTPILNVIFFLNQLKLIIEMDRILPQQLTDAKKFTNLMLA